MLNKNHKFLLKCALVLPFLLIIDYSGILTHLLEVDFEKHFYYPLNNQSAEAEFKISSYKYLHMPKSVDHNQTRLTILIKSAIGNAQRRDVIRKTWGYEARFTDVYIKRVFLLGVSSNYKAAEPDDIDRESQMHSDIVRADFVDAYFNNTIKTMLGLRWANEHARQSEFYLFVDDDYYVSVKNMLRFLRDYKMRAKSSNKLFLGYVFQSAPLRHKFSKWYVPLDEYPFDKWPPYVTAGAFLLSHEALRSLYEVSKKLPLFRFDDIHMGILALKAHIPVHHCRWFYFEKLRYLGPDSYSEVLASHGYHQADELEKVWNECRSANYA